VSVPHDAEQVMRTIEFVREHGYLCSFNQLVPGVGAVSCPLPALGDGEHLAITVAGSVDRIERRSQQIISTLQREVRAFQMDKPLLATTVAAAQVAEWAH
jgi:DNA-binding IclR family transcriptional regulator